MTDQNDDGKKSNKRRHPSGIDEAIGAGMLGGNGPFNKGPWTSEEDTMLREYVQEHGERNWHFVEKYSGLFRSQQSCRSRWVNHLKPNLKKGPFTQQEEQRIVELHAQIGNKWAKIAAQLPGRTDREIKDYWRKKQWKIMQPADQWSPNVEFINLDLDRLASSMSASRFDMHASSMVKQGISSPNTHNFSFPTLRPSKRPRESETMSAGLDGSVSSDPVAFGQLTDYAFERIPEPIGLCTQYDSDLSSTYDQPETGVPPGDHVLLNDYTSSSEPMYGPMNLELPSFQYSETQQDSWCMPTFPLPSFEPAVDTLIQSPTVEQTESECLWPRDSGQLDSLLYGTNSGKSLQRSAVQQNPELSSVLHTDASVSNMPLSESSSSLFSQSTPIIARSSYDPGCDFTHEELNQASTQQPEEKATSEQMDFSGPNVLSDSWCRPSFPLPSFEPVDTLIQSPPVEQMQSDWSINSGLLDSLLYGPNADKSLQRSFVQQDPEASFSLTDAADRSFITPIQADPITPLGQSASSLFSESTPISGTSSSYNTGFDFNHEALDQASTQQPEAEATSEQMDFSGPNVLPGSGLGPLPREKKKAKK